MHFFSYNTIFNIDCKEECDHQHRSNETVDEEKTVNPISDSIQITNQLGDGKIVLYKHF